MQRFFITNSDIGAENFRSNGAVLAIGNLDGVHKGHAALLNRTKQLAAEKGVGAAVMTFSPHPRLFFQPDAPPFLLSDDHGKAARLEESGIDCLYTVQFNAALAEMSAIDFIRGLPVGTAGCSAVVVGEDFRFGKSRLGDTDILAQAGDAYGFILHTIPLVASGEDAISSSRIRDHIRTGDIAAANALLGYSRRYPLRLLGSEPAESGLTCLSAQLADPALLLPKTGGYTGFAYVTEDSDKAEKTPVKVFILQSSPDLVKIFYDARFYTLPQTADAIITLQAGERTKTQDIAVAAAGWLAQQENKRESI